MSRPEKFFKTLDNLKEFVVREDYEVVTVLDLSDETMNNDEVKERAKAYPQVKLNYTNTTGKVDAINKGLEFISPDYEIIILVADDVEFTVKGFDYIIEVEMRKWFPDLSGCLHFPDGIAQVGDKQITVPICGRKLIDLWGYIYHPSYQSVYCDNEMLAILKIMKKVKYINTKILLHRHPVWHLSEWDDLYRKNEDKFVYKTDSDNFFKRQSTNFGL